MARLAATAQGTIAYSVSGAGEPLVLVPGFQTTRLSWRFPGDYLALLDGHRVISVDPLGHGESSRSHNQADYTATNLVTQITSVLDRENIDQAHIWGFSRGGQIAALCAEVAPERCLSTVMGATPLGSAWDLAMAEIVAAEPFLAIGDWEGYWSQWSGEVPDTVRQRLERTNDPLALAAALRASMTWATDHPRFGLNACKVPRFAYFGPGEPWAGALRSELAATDIEVFEGTWPGHAQTLYDAQGVVAEVVPFLDSCHPDTSS